MRPLRSAATTFNGGPPKRFIASRASSSDFASSISSKPTSTPSGCCAVACMATGLPISAVSLTGPQIVSLTGWITCLPPLILICSLTTSNRVHPLEVLYSSGLSGLISNRTKSRKSPLIFVKPHATCPLDPMMTAGTPGKTMPVVSTLP